MWVRDVPTHADGRCHMRKPPDSLTVDFSDQRFRTLELRALRELGLLTVVVWLTLLLQVLLRLVGGQHLRLSLPYIGLDLFTYNAWVAVGFSMVWLLALTWTHTWVVLGEEELRVEKYGVRLWRVYWRDIAAWTWLWHWTGVPMGVTLVTRKGGRHDLRLGFIGLGRRRGKLVHVFPDYVPLIKALTGYVPGEEWQEHVPWHSKTEKWS